MQGLSHDNIIFLQKSEKIIICVGQTILTKVESNDGSSISKIKVSEDGDSLIYITEKGSVIHFDINKEKSEILVNNINIENFIDILRMKTEYIVLCKETINTLSNLKVSFLFKIDICRNFLIIELNIYKIINNFF